MEVYEDGTMPAKGLRYMSFQTHMKLLRHSGHTPHQRVLLGCKHLQARREARCTHHSLHHMQLDALGCYTHGRVQRGVA